MGKKESLRKYLGDSKNVRPCKLFEAVYNMLDFMTDARSMTDATMTVVESLGAFWDELSNANNANESHKIVMRYYETFNKTWDGIPRPKAKFKVGETVAL